MIDRADIQAVYPLSPLQRAMLLQSQLHPGSGVYLVQMHFDLCGSLDPVALRQAWASTVARHDMHRTLFVRLEEPKPLQVVRHTAELPWQELDWSDEHPARQERRFAELIGQDKSQDFDPAQAPLMRITVVRLAEDRHRVLWTRHHAISDGWSMPIVIGDVLRDYAALAGGAVPAVAPAPQFRDYISWLRGRDLTKDEDYWRSTLSGVTGPTPFAVDRPLGRDTLGLSSVRKHRTRLTAATTAALAGAARRERITLSTFVLGAWAILLRRYSGEHDVVTGTVVAGRPPVLEGADAMAGCFLNILPVRVLVDDEKPVFDWLRQLQSDQVDREEHGYVPLGTIRNWAGLRGDTPLFESLVVFENVPLGATTRLGDSPLTVENASMSEHPGFPLTLTAVPGDELSLQLCYDVERFDAATITRMLGHLETVLTALAGTPGTLRTLPVLTGPELAVLTAVTPAVQPHFGALALHELFREQVRRTPTADALVVGEQVLSYAELDKRSDILASSLRAAGVVDGTLVGVCLEREAHLPVSILAVLKAGGAYVPLDPAYPESRIAQIVGDARPPVVLAQSSTQDLITAGTRRILLVDDPATVVADPAVSPAATVHEQSVAMVIYTSGSTGTPKGVRITHGNVRALLEWGRREFDPGDLAGTLASTSICFDLSVFELFLPLCTGGAVVLVPNVLLLPSAPGRDRVTLVNTVPSAMDALLRADGLPAGVRAVNLAGEPLPRTLVDRLHAQDSDRLVRNLYGPSEDTVYSTWARIPRGSGKPLIGVPVGGSQVYVLDSAGAPAPVGVPGELYLGGDGVSQGYHERPSLTADRYVPDPFGSVPGARLYRTGDLVRRHDDGQLEYLGRNDRQVKLRGFRIELGEIESALRALDGVSDAASVVYTGERGVRRLIAYAVGTTLGPGALQPGRLLDALRNVLPQYMIPTAVLVLDRIPLTPNGKVDWQALPAPEPTVAQRSSRVPSGPIESAVAEVWTAVLGIEQPGADDSFFDIGGDSLTLAQVFGQLRRVFPGQLAITDLFRHPTIAALARHLEVAPGEEASPAFAEVQNRIARRRAARERSVR
ncbi:amino acid adenylation domain-containing protein [Nocardia sp. bgisy118]|uniref:amino acid adenylation domain-containing protein n=1 Tax=Nocardia sp. bgisy118 TaxID=3413786 RepID=UPI003F4A3389